MAQRPIQSQGHLELSVANLEANSKPSSTTSAAASSSQHLHNSHDLGNRILRNPSEYLQSFCDAVTDATRNIDSKYLTEGEQMLVGFEGLFVSRRVTPRDLLSEFIGSMVCVEGIITK